MAAVRTIEERRKKHEPTEALALKWLREDIFTSMLDRCYLVRQEDVTKEMKECLLMTLLSQPGNGFSKSAISPLLRAGIVNDDSKFSCRAAPWCYNRNCFPGRPLDPPDTLRDLIMLSIGSMPAKRLRDAVQSGFPKEAMRLCLHTCRRDMPLSLNSMLSQSTHYILGLNQCWGSWISM